MTSLPADRAASQAASTGQRHLGGQPSRPQSRERVLNSELAAAKQEQLIQEFAAELTPTPEELAEAYGSPDKADNEAPSGKAGQNGAPANGNLDVILRIPVPVQVVLGSATMSISGLVKLGRGAVIALDRRVGEPVDVVVNGRIVARGEVVVMDDDQSRFGISLTEVVTAAGSVGDA